MKKNFTNKIGVLLLLLISTLFNYVSADQPIAPPSPPGIGGGTGTGGSGAAASPIDMYQVLLLVAAIFLIIYFYNKTKLVKN